MTGKPPFVLCLTGSLGMGKSRTATFFAEAGVPVHDSDAVVHALYEGEAVPLIESVFPGATSDGKVDRVKLAAMVVGDAAAIARLEFVVHPLVSEAREKFLAAAQAAVCLSSCSTFHCCSKPAAMTAVTRSLWYRRRPKCNGAALSSGRA